MKALLIVDVQNDFCPGGALPAPNGNVIVPVINSLFERFPLIIASRDWHPKNTRHFEKWPVHCVQGTVGAEYNPKLNTEEIDIELLKGTSDIDDGYSAFEATNLNLNDFLRSREVTDVFITGLTTEYCVKNTATDSLRNGFNTFMVTDAIAAVEPGSENEKTTLLELKEMGARLLKIQYVHQT